MDVYDVVTSKDDEDLRKLIETEITRARNDWKNLARRAIGIPVVDEPFDQGYLRIFIATYKEIQARKQSISSALKKVRLRPEWKGPVEEPDHNRWKLYLKAIPIEDDSNGHDQPTQS